MSFLPPTRPTPSVPARFLRAGRRARVLLAAGTLLWPAAPAILPAPALARPAPDSFADLAAALLPSVVNISSTETLHGNAQGEEEDDDGPDDDAPDGGSGNGGADKDGKGQPDRGAPVPSFPPGSPFEKFFHDFMNRHGGSRGGDGNGAAGPARKMQSLGSGFIIDPSGLVVTNNHVIKGADTITVTLQDNTVLKAKLVGHDDKTDLALLKVEAGHPLAAVSFGDSDRMRVGDWVVAIGNPFGLSGTVTAGIVSSRGRSLDSGPYDDFIQTDAPINRGNSGGPLFDMDGHVIGINTAIYSPSGGSIGIGFAIPSNEAKPVLDQLRQFGKARRGWIGVRIQDVTPDIADSLGLKPPKGALVAGLEPDGPAAKAGLKTGDVIRKVDNKDVDGRSLPRVVGETAVGRSVPLDVWRDNKPLSLSVTVRDFPEEQAAPAKAARAPARPAPSTAMPLAGLGMTLVPLDDAVRGKYGLQPDQKGVAVSDVAAGGAASDRGIHPGDVILEVQQSEVSSPADVRNRIEDARRLKRPSVVMLVQNGDGMRWVPLPVQGAVQKN
ncbi:DegQ family serine endoprotease [Rhizosaccharibacter radicis]|uniref:Probable periplasmic serine endoprotease DegP-like n=1 Tax=Rhizosaccharibacter radicis TaxID=2782605 RepID=A0ABT1W2E4_9PROT|nr:DegQ family serine endoprotease [Acetobacteraceae bacterium KSS12]